MTTITGAQSSEEFTFNWLALKLLGKSLYSYLWAAVSELVANGLDAGAKNVWVLLDVSNGKKDSTLEILDDGVGMDRNGIHTYVKVGYDKKVDPESTTVVDSPMGRKGIGKLATLYLSDEFFLATKHDGEDSTWHFRVDENATGDDHPKLDLLEDHVDFALANMWTESSQGTLVQVKHMNLEGFGDAALDALDTKLANQFLLSSLHDCHIWFCRKDASTTPFNFSKVSKEVAFKNFLMVFHNYPQKDQLPQEIESLDGRKVKMGPTEEGVEFPVRVESMHRLDSYMRRTIKVSQYKAS